MNSLITLITDFGLQDTYVGVMKGIMAQINPNLQIIDLTHEIPRQDLLSARFCLLDAYVYFRKGTVYLAVVDPGVGSSRLGVAIAFEQGYLVGPDNGIFSGVLDLSPPSFAVALTNPQYWLTPNPSTTFHGRDIFAPVAAHLASGVPIACLGEEIEPHSLVTLNLPQPQEEGDGILGLIQYVDVFGNLITNISGAMVKGKSWGVEVKGEIIQSANTYSDTISQELIALVGSHGWVEVAVNGGNAKAVLELDTGDGIKIKLQKSLN